MIVIIKEQRGFTLLELMVALAIFAMLAVAGWQVFDSVSRAREQAQVQADHLAVLQQAYLQIQQDLGQIIAYQTLEVQNTSLQNGSDDANNQPANNQNNDNSSSNTVDAKPFMLLDKERLRFIRFADPDPRYQNSTSLQRVEYILSEERLIRRQYVDVRGDNDSVSLDSVVLEGISAASWQAYLPEISASFPNNSSNTETGNNSTASNGLAQNTPTDMAKSQKALLPKGISISFTYQDIPITWQWALTPQPAPLTSHPIATKSNNDSSNSNNSNSNNSNNNGSNNNGSNNNGNTSNTSSVNKEVGNDPMGL